MYLFFNQKFNNFFDWLVFYFLSDTWIRFLTIIIEWQYITTIFCPFVVTNRFYISLIRKCLGSHNCLSLVERWIDYDRRDLAWNRIVPEFFSQRCIYINIRRRSRCTYTCSFHRLLSRVACVRSSRGACSPFQRRRDVKKDDDSSKR